MAYAVDSNHALDSNLKVLWLTRTSIQVAHTSVAHISRETRSLPIRSLPIYGRRTVCLHEAVSKIDLRRFNSACRAVRRAGRCPYWPGSPKALNPPLTVNEVKNIARRLPACPHDCLTRSLAAVRSVVATHMQLNNIAWLLSKWRVRRGDVVLIIDEGQHIIKKSLSMVKDSISLRTVEKAAKEAAKYGFNDLGEGLRRAVEEYRAMLTGDGELEVEDLLPDTDELALAGDEVQEQKLKENYVPASHLLSLADFKISLNGRRPILVREGGRYRLEAPMDPVEALRAIYDGWRAVITVSATISGELVEALTGREVVLLRGGWPFDEENLTAYIVKGLSTRFEERDEKLIDDLAWATELAARSGKRSLVFYPSHDLVQRALQRIGDKSRILVEEPGLWQEEVEALAHRFEEGGGTIVGVFNGRLAEGVDLSADLVMCLGVPFAPPTAKQVALLRRLSEILGDERRARIYGQILPALWSAIQAAGRAVRSPEDKALILLVDDRYKALYRLLPRWFQERVSGTVDFKDLPILLEVGKSV